jgi:hypothetical protein
MVAQKSDTIAVNGATTGISHRSQSVISAAVIVAWTLAAAGMDAEDFGWLSREILTGFPEFRRKIARGWKLHQSEYL